MLPRIASGTLWCALLLALTAFQPAARAQTASPPKTRNVVLIVSDGLRWQEVFTGADPLLLVLIHPDTEAALTSTLLCARSRRAYQPGETNLRNYAAGE